MFSVVKRIVGLGRVGRGFVFVCFLLGRFVFWFWLRVKGVLGLCFLGFVDRGDFSRVRSSGM